MVKILNFLPQRLIELCFYALFFLVPLVLTPFNYELFEYNKMMLAYGLTAIIVGSWVVKITVNKRINLKRTPLDIPLLLFLASQIISTVISLDRHVSIWGYYSRFNGGLLSTISYLLLYWAFVSNFPGEKIGKLLKIALASGVLVSVYAVLEHLGIDKNIWVQDVQNRVFSTLGQPNWLAAYLAVLIPITAGIGLTNLIPADLSSNGKNQKSKIKNQNYNSNFKNENNTFIASLFIVLIVSLYYATLIFTKSRSGFLGFWISFALLTVYLIWKYQQAISKFLLCSIVSLSIVTFLFGAPFDQINRFTFPELFNHQPLTTNQQPVSAPAGSSLIEIGVTGSDTIRKIVWSGALDIYRHYPLFGTGVETFAFAYYKFRPVAHNMTSEWDFLYNKAHNEYLNYAATTGSFGLGSYLLIILVFIGWNLKELKNKNSKIKTTVQSEKLLALNSDFTLCALRFALFSAWLSILITNFFGFSVVIVQLFFFLIPAITFVLCHSGEQSDSRIPSNIKDSGQARMTIIQYILISINLFFIFYFLYFISRLWYADVLFADGYHKARSDEITQAYQSLKKALEINENEPLYYDEFSFPAAQIAVALNDDKQTTFSGALTREAIIASTYAINHASQNINFWKTRTRVFYALSAIDEKYFSDSLYALEQAKLLSPTDPKVRYNLGLLYDRIGKKNEAIAELTETTKLKPDYRDAFYALAYLYEKNNERDKAKEALKYILIKIATDDAQAKKKLEELK